MINRRLAAVLAATLAATGYVAWSDGLFGAGESASPRARVSMTQSGADTALQGPLNPLARRGLAEFDAILLRPLFNPGRAPAVVVAEAPVIIAAAPALAEPEVTADDFTLVAIASNADGAFAIVKVNASGEVLHVRQGADLAGWAIARIEGREVLLARDGKTITLKLFATPAAPPLPPDRA
jgi:hypothetical protein